MSDLGRSLVDAPASHAAQALTMIAEDTLFAIASTSSVDTEAWRSLAERRAEAYGRTARGQAAESACGSFEAWLSLLCRAAAPSLAIPWLPMNELVARGVTLEGGARGARSLFTSKPSEKEITRVRRLGSLALRAATAVMVADGAFTAEEERFRTCLVSAFGLDETDARALLAEPPTPATQIEIYGELDPKLAAALVRGAWLTGAHDGLVANEEETVAVLAGKAGVAMQAAADMRNEARSDVEARYAFGRLGADLVRLLLGDEPVLAQRLASLVAQLCVPVLYRSEVLASVQRGTTVTLTDRASVDRKRKAGALGFAWVACLASNPSLSRRAELASKHDLAAAQLGELADASRARSVLNSYIETLLGAAVRA